jgi:hypothetical protein
VASRIPGKWPIGLTLALLAVLIAYAWIDGGREPVREISEPVPVPEQPA